MRNFTAGSYALAGTAYLLLLLWLLLQGKIRKASEICFESWLVLLSALGFISMLMHLSSNAQTAYVLYRTHFTLLFLSSVALWFFSTSLLRELTGNDIIYALPVLFVIPPLWIVLIKGVVQTPYGWDIVFINYPFFIFLAILFSYYFTSIFQLFRVYSAVKLAGSKTARQGVRNFLFAVTFLTLISFLQPIGRMLHLYFVIIFANLLYILGITLMAYSFRLTEK